MKELSDDQRERIKPLFPRKDLEPDGAGRSSESERQVLDGILWILRIGAQWQDKKSNIS